MAQRKASMRSRLLGRVQTPSRMPLSCALVLPRIVAMTFSPASPGWPSVRNCILPHREEAALCITAKVRSNNRHGSFATDRCAPKIASCPLFAESDVKSEPWGGGRREPRSWSTSCVIMKLQNEPKALGSNFSSLHFGNQRTRLTQQFNEPYTYGRQSSARPIFARNARSWCSLVATIRQRADQPQLPLRVLERK